ncbi:MULTISPECIES: DNA polymerase III subunit delta [Acidithrix]|uniref:DNA-directed DNA polymerase n=1 Tax=Acidithrix ferrooxidans TaxID=1280514 RepID=A0A0D8HG90_9ACTN|nr:MULTISPECIES: hypothetical protein [Acidithrix]KJF16086.1 DNA polymerase III subunit delta [Acidithrix ferrooxidans]
MDNELSLDHQKRIFLIRGNDPRLVQDGEAAAIESLQKKGQLEVVTFESSSVEGSQVVMALSQAYMFSDGAIVTLRSIDALDSSLTEMLGQYLIKATEERLFDNYLVLSSSTGTIDSKLLKSITTCGQVIDLKLGDAKDRRSFLENEIRSSSLSFEAGVTNLIANHFGEDVARVRSLLEVLEATFGSGSRLGVEEIEPYLNRAGSQPLYLLTSAIEEARANSESKVLGELRRFIDDSRIHPLLVYTTISRRIIEIAAVHGLLNYSVDEINRALVASGMRKKNDFPAKKLASAASVLTYDDVLKALEYCAETEGRMKGLDGISDRFALELLVARLTNLFGRRNQSSSRR